MAQHLVYADCSPRNPDRPDKPSDLREAAISCFLTQEEAGSPTTLLVNVHGSDTLWVPSHLVLAGFQGLGEPGQHLWPPWPSPGLRGDSCRPGHGGRGEKLGFEGCVTGVTRSAPREPEAGGPHFMREPPPLGLELLSHPKRLTSFSLNLKDLHKHLGLTRRKIFP